MLKPITNELNATLKYDDNFQKSGLKKNIKKSVLLSKKYSEHLIYTILSTRVTIYVILYTLNSYYIRGTRSTSGSNRRNSRRKKIK